MGIASIILFAFFDVEPIYIAPVFMALIVTDKIFSNTNYLSSVDTAFKVNVTNHPIYAFGINFIYLIIAIIIIIIGRMISDTDVYGMSLFLKDSHLLIYWTLSISLVFCNKLQYWWTWAVLIGIIITIYSFLLKIFMVKEIFAAVICVMMLCIAFSISVSCFLKKDRDMFNCSLHCTVLKKYVSIR